MAFAETGDLARAEKIAAALERQFPRNTMINSYWVPTIRSSIQIERGSPAKAIEILQAAQGYDLANSSAGPAGLLEPVYQRGRAYLQLGQSQRAIEEFQKFLIHRGVAENGPLAALAYLELARATRLNSDALKTRSAYEQFLRLWKNADADIPVFEEARKEYARLH